MSKHSPTVTYSTHWRQNGHSPSKTRSGRTDGGWQTLRGAIRCTSIDPNMPHRQIRASIRGSTIAPREQLRLLVAVSAGWSSLRLCPSSRPQTTLNVIPAEELGCRLTNRPLREPSRRSCSFPTEKRLPGCGPAGPGGAKARNCIQSAGDGSITPGFLICPSRRDGSKAGPLYFLAQLLRRYR